MVQRRRWDHFRNEQLRHRAGAEEVSERALIDTAASRRQHEADILYLEDLLKKDLKPYDKLKCEASIAWLKESPTRTLGPPHQRSGWRSYFGRISQAIASGVYGTRSITTPEQQEEWSKMVKKKTRQMVCRKARVEEMKPVLPDWQQDPSKLPKKPPGVG